MFENLLINFHGIKTTTELPITTVSTTQLTETIHARLVTINIRGDINQIHVEQRTRH